MLHHFPITDSESPKKGECKILLGDKFAPQQITDTNDLTTGGKKNQVFEKAFGAGLGCFSLAASATKFAATAVAGGYATAQTGGVAAPVVIPALITDGAGVLTSGFYCVLKTRETIDAVSEFQLAENHALFASAMSEASNKTLEKLEQTGEIKTFYKLSASQNPTNLAIASALWNRTLVKVFNKDVNGTFENGWGKESKFFDAVEKVKNRFCFKSSDLYSVNRIESK